VHDEFFLEILLPEVRSAESSERWYVILRWSGRLKMADERMWCSAVSVLDAEAGFFGALDLSDLVVVDHDVNLPELQAGDFAAH
jgi:hypothetical protein